MTWSIVRRSVFWEIVSMLSSGRTAAFGNDSVMSVIDASPAFHEMTRLVQTNTMLRMSRKTLGLPDAFHERANRAASGNEDEEEKEKDGRFFFFPNVSDMFYMVHDMYREAEQQGYEEPCSEQAARRLQLGTAIEHMLHVVDTNSLVSSMKQTSFE